MSDKIDTACAALEAQVELEWEIMMDSLKERDTFGIETEISRIDELQTIIKKLKGWQ